MSNAAQRLMLTGTHRTVSRPVGMIVNRPEGGALFRVARRSPMPGTQR